MQATAKIRRRGALPGVERRLARELALLADTRNVSSRRQATEYCEGPRWGHVAAATLALNLTFTFNLLLLGRLRLRRRMATARPRSNSGE